VVQIHLVLLLLLLFRLLLLLLVVVVVVSAGQHQVVLAGTQQQQQQQQRQRRQRLQCYRGHQALGRRATMKLQPSPLLALLLLLLSLALLWTQRASAAHWHPALGSPPAMVPQRLMHRLQLQIGLPTDTAAAQAQRQQGQMVILTAQQQQQGSRLYQQTVKGGSWCLVMCRLSRRTVRVIWRRWILLGHWWSQWLTKVGPAGIVALQASYPCSSASC
jgi:hypothetical protein